MKIYTKTGDDGNTGLQGDLRISKSHERIFAYGAIDEANASLGVILSQKLDSDISEVLQKIQNELFILGSDLSNPNLSDLRNRVSKKMIENFSFFDSSILDMTELPGEKKSISLRKSKISSIFQNYKISFENQYKVFSLTSNKLLLGFAIEEENIEKIIKNFDYYK